LLFAVLASAACSESSPPTPGPGGAGGAGAGRGGSAGAGNAAGSGPSDDGAAGGDDSGSDAREAGQDGTACAWLLLEPSGARPSPRISRGVSYDPQGRRLLVVGGYGSESATPSDMWALSLTGPPVWTEIATTVSMPLSGGPYGSHSIIDGQHLIQMQSTSSPVWMLDLAGPPVFTPLATENPLAVPLFIDNVVLDAPTRRLVFFGANVGGRYLPEPFALSLSNPATWNAIMPPGDMSSPVLLERIVVVDGPRRRLIVFGGNGAPIETSLWALTLSDPPAWSRLAAIGQGPYGAMGNEGAYDPLGQRLLVFTPSEFDPAGGGGGAAGAPPDGGEDLRPQVFSLSLSGDPVWKRLATRGETPRWFRRRPVYDEGNDRMLFFGGRALDGDTNDVWALDLASCR
jgi:hypothetical protein